MSNPIKETWRAASYDGGWDCVRNQEGDIICKLGLNEPANSGKIATAYNATYGAGIDPAGIERLVKLAKDISEVGWMTAAERDEWSRDIQGQAGSILAALNLNKEEA